MAGKYSFQLQSGRHRQDLPHKILIGQQDAETETQVLLKLLGFLLFHRERLQIGTWLPDDNIPYRPDLSQLDHTLRVVLWIECGPCSADKLDRLAVKVPEAEIWILRSSSVEAEQLLHQMTRAELRRGRYQVIGFDSDMFAEMLGLLRTRNEVVWVAGRFDPPLVQLDFNGLWFDAEFGLWRF